MRRAFLSPLPLALAVLWAYGCGGGESIQEPEAPTDQPEQPAELDFSPVEGVWAGSAVEVSGIAIEIRIGLESGARRGRTIGSVRYWLPHAPDDVCLGTWLAESVDSAVFTVNERITSGNCPDGTVRLTLDQETGDLHYSYTPDNGIRGFEASGTLRRQ